MADPLTNLSSKEGALLAYAFLCFKNGFDNSAIDYDKLSDLGGYTNVNSCKNAMAAIRKKLQSLDVNDSNDKFGDAASAKEPAKSASKRKVTTKETTTSPSKEASTAIFPNLKRKVSETSGSPGPKPEQKRPATIKEGGESADEWQQSGDDEEFTKASASNKVRRTTAARMKKGKAQESSASTTAASVAKKASTQTDKLDEKNDDGLQSPAKAEAASSEETFASSSSTIAKKNTSGSTNKGKGKRASKKHQASSNGDESGGNGDIKASLAADVA